MKKGFTIIEVLAVIVVVTLLTVLIVPNIINITSSKKADVSEASKKIIYDEADIYVKANKISFPIAEGATYCIKLETLVNSGNLVAPVKDLANNKEIPLNYYVKVTLDSYEQYNYELVSECSSIGGVITDTTPPTIANVTLKTKTSNSITVTASGYDQESGIAYYQFSKNNGKTWSEVQQSNEYTFGNLKTGTYKIKSRVINGSYIDKVISKNYKDSSTNEIETGVITKPQCSVNVQGWAASKTVTCVYPEGTGYIYQYSLNDGDTWNSYNGPIVFNDNGSIIAQVKDSSDNYVQSNSLTITGIDTTGPSASASIGTRTTTSVVVNATCSDDSDISLIEYSSDNGVNYTADSTNTSHTFTGLSQGTSYNFKVRCTNGVSLSTESSAVVGVTKATAVFNGNGGTNGTSITKDVGVALGTLPTSTRTGYTFDGWYTEQNGGTQISSSTTMPSGGKTYYAHWKEPLNSVVKVGDYVRMTPNPGTLDSQDRYSTDINKTGYNSVEYIYPKELNLWRVIRINSNGTIDMVSEYVSSNTIHFLGTVGYANYVGYLNTLAAQYENGTYTIGSRYMGYLDQTETIANTVAFNGSSNNAPWTSSTTSTANQKPSNESQGGGDTRYTTDTNLVTTAIGNLIALSCNDTSCSSPNVASIYWIASRNYTYSSNIFLFKGHAIEYDSLRTYVIRGNYGGNWGNGDYGFLPNCSLRPIVILKSGLSYTGSGTIGDPYVLQ